MSGSYKIAYWLRTDIQHFAHIRPIYDNLGGVILTKNPDIYNYLLENFPSITDDLFLVKNSFEARKILNRMNIGIVVYTGFQMVFWGYSIQVFHGVSDKCYLLENKQLLLYDLLLLPGKKHLEKIRGAYKWRHPERLKVVGYPKFDKLIANSLSYTPLFDNGKSTILYAPTWISEDSGPKLKFSSHGECSLLWWGTKLISAIAPRWNLIIKYHSRINKRYSGIYKEIDQFIIDNGLEKSVRVVWDSDITQYMLEANIMISDISAVCYEWFHTNRPILFANPAPDHYKPSTDGLSSTYAWQAGDVLYKEEDILPAVRNNLASDKHKAIRNKLLNHSFYKPDGNATARQLSEIVKFYERVEKYSKLRMVLHNLAVFIRDSVHHALKKIEKS